MRSPLSARLSQSERADGMRFGRNSATGCGAAFPTAVGAVRPKGFAGRAARGLDVVPGGKVSAGLEYRSAGGSRRQAITTRITPASTLTRMRRSRIGQLFSEARAASVLHHMSRDRLSVG